MKQTLFVSKYTFYNLHVGLCQIGHLALSKQFKIESGAMNYHIILITKTQRLIFRPKGKPSDLGVLNATIPAIRYQELGKRRSKPMLNEKHSQLLCF